MDKGKLFIAVAAVILVIFTLALAWSIVSLVRLEIPSHTSSIGFTFKTADGSLPLWPTQHADDGNFSGLITVEPSADCLLMAMVDYRVVPFYFNGSYNTTHYLSGSPTDKYPGVFSVTNLSEGFHDVILLGLVSPYNYTSDAWGMSYRLPMAGTLRFNVIVGNATKPSVFVENRSTAVNTVYSSDNRMFSALSKKPFDNRMPFKEALKPGAAFDYYVNVGHGLVDREIRNTGLAIVQLLDYRQLPVRYDAADYVYYGYIDRSENCSVHMSFKAPETVGLHRLVNIVVTDPYADLETVTGAMNTAITQSDTFEHMDFEVVK
jgi:hypothetical protein